jgi:hypothetical protein
MALIIENGNVIANADSFISYADAYTKAQNLGLSFSDDATTGEQQLRQAYLWLINMYESQLQGSRVSKDQTGCFPRFNVESRGFVIDADEIPTDVINAQLFSASAVNGGVDINKVKDTADLKSFSVDGVYSEEYKDSSSTPAVANMPQVYNFMKSFTRSGGGLSLTRDDYTIGNTRYEW